MTQEIDVEQGGGMLQTPVVVATTTTATSTAATSSTGIPPEQVVETVKSSLQEKLALVKTLLGVSTFSAFFKGLRKELPALAQVSTYSKPKSLEEVKSRVQANFPFFKFTYTTVCVVVTAMFVLSSPVLLLFGLLLTFLWLWVLGHQADASITIRGREFGARERLFLAVFATLVYIVLGGVISTVLYIALCNLLLIGSHASLREPIVLDELAIMEQETDAIISADNAGGA